jgi:hypothetical protein
MRFEVLTGAKMSVLIYWIVMPRGLVGRYQSFEGTSTILIIVYLAFEITTVIHGKQRPLSVND